ncbi:hypothetical protein AU380_14445 [Pseudomonas aeruginosa]|nr:hypothetical protein AU380_14445 [Pseudomonas aeruginosa]
MRQFSRFLIMLKVCAWVVLVVSFTFLAAIINSFPTSMFVIERLCAEKGLVQQSFNSKDRQLGIALPWGQLALITR